MSNLYKERGRLAYIHSGLWDYNSYSLTNHRDECIVSSSSSALNVEVKYTSKPYIKVLIKGEFLTVFWSLQQTLSVVEVVRLAASVVVVVRVVRGVVVGLEPASPMLTLQSSWSSHRHQIIGRRTPLYVHPRSQSSSQPWYERHGTPGQNLSSIQPKYTSAQNNVPQCSPTVLRSATRSDFQVPRTRLKFGERVFNVAAPNFPRRGTTYHWMFVLLRTLTTSSRDLKHFYSVVFFNYPPNRFCVKFVPNSLLDCSASL